MLLQPMTKTLIAAGLMSLGMALTNPVSAFDIEAKDEGARLLDAMIGQMIMVGFAGDNERDPGVVAVRDQLAKGIIGGVVFYPENISSSRQLRNLIAVLRHARSNPAPFIAVDQEGGKVQRLTRNNGFGHFPSARSVGRNPSFASLESAVRLYATMAEELAQAGFNLNFGPVVDLNLNPANPVIGGRDRSFGADPTIVTMLARAFIIAHRDANIVTVAKHFPGHGSSRVDSHKALADVSETWREIELEPYRTLAKDGLLDAVMIGHLYHPRFSDGARLPASLSGRAMQALRAKGYIGFKGVVVSDDMEMGAVRDHYSLEERVIKAVNAGTDLLVFSNVKSPDPELGPRIHAVIADAVRDGRISRARIEKAYGKIRLLKRRLAEKDLSGKW
jgi:beta-N-acetylhexosaminidase